MNNAGPTLSKKVRSTQHFSKKYFMRVGGADGRNVSFEE